MNPNNSWIDNLLGTGSSSSPFPDTDENPANLRLNEEFQDLQFRQNQFSQEYEYHGSQSQVNETQFESQSPDVTQPPERAPSRGGRLKRMSKKAGAKLKSVAGGSFAKPATRWTDVEERLLAECFIEVSEDSTLGNDQNSLSFWQSVEAIFNKDPPNVPRTKDMITGKWSTLNRDCQKFNAIYKRLKRLYRSGESEVDLLSRVRSQFRDETSRTFTNDLAWEFLRNKNKWDPAAPIPTRSSFDESVRDSPSSAAGGSSQPDFSELFGDDVRPRPSGKPRKAKKAKSTSTSDTGGSSAAERGVEVLREEMRLKREAAMKAYTATETREYIQTRMEELRFLTTPTAGLSDRDRKAIEKEKDRIHAKYFPEE